MLALYWYQWIIMTQRKHVLLIGAKDHTTARINQLGQDYSLIQLEYLATDRQQASASHYVELPITQAEMVQPDIIQKVMALAIEIHRKRPIDAVVTFLEFTQEVTHEIAQILSIPSNIGGTALALTRCKLAMRAAIAKAGISTVLYSEISSLEQLYEFCQKQSLPIILKPSRGAASAGVCLIETEDQIADAYDHAAQYSSDPLIAETYIDSQNEISVETISRSGEHQIVAITQKQVQGPPFFVEEGHCQPANLPIQLSDEIYALVLRLLTLIEHQTGPAHTEIKIWNGRPYIIESQIRIGGDQIWELTEITTGISQIKETIIHLLSLPSAPPTTRSPAAAIRFIMPDTHNLRRPQVVGISEPSIIRISLEPDSQWKAASRATHSGQRLGYIMAKGETVEQVNSVINNVI
ncbi:Phosphoribosylglycinamide synthetase, ATP-grasp (A) domain protein [Shewanella piezotolerans WP3]|uniref:Phosphoribosylglycinamide synthetase, ATP-grasp (A) domain protein n=2 Tax=Shewanella TaxID=22 RepID=B8CTR1_SHEPW|nr:Phosphoribosylglycinamide synthetase, ATP-grasp (A) domain protein [Shewanella piezotolerans WP3]